MVHTNDSHDRMIAFIQLLKGPSAEDGNDAHGILEEIYMNGNCYTWAKAVQLVFPNIELYSVGFRGKTGVNHVVIKLDQRFYDIRGEIRMEEQDYAWWHAMTDEEERFSQQFHYSTKGEVSG